MAIRLFVIYILAIPLLLFQNCGKNFASNSANISLNSFCKLQPQSTTPFDLNKLQWTPETTGQQKLSSQIPNLALVVNLRCLGDRTQISFLNQTLDIPDNTDLPNFFALSLKLTQRPSTETLQQALDTNPCFIGLAEDQPVQQSQTVVNDPQAKYQGHLAFLGYSQTWDLQALVTAPTIVAIVDSGIDYNHDDLKNRMWRDAQNRVGRNFVNTNVEPMDDEGHGTHVAGIVAAEVNNNTSVAGLTPNAVSLMAVKVLDQSGAGSSQAVYNGIQYAIEQGADIINVSLEAQGTNALIESAIVNAIQAGIVVVVAAGNQGQEITPTNLYAPAYVGKDHLGVITVGSLDSRNGDSSYFSNFSTSYVEIAAPGAENSSNNLGILSTGLNNTAVRVMGTSQATPMVSAAAALIIGALKARDIAYSPAAIEEFLKTNGSAVSSKLGLKVNGGSSLHLGVLSTNLMGYLELINPSDEFDGKKPAQRTCTIQ